MPFNMTPNWVYCLFISCFLLFGITEQALGGSRADSISSFVLGQEYKIWKAANTPLANQLTWELYEHYKGQKNWELGFKTLFRFNLETISKQEKLEIQVQKALMDFLLDFPQKAIENCLAVENDSLSSVQRKLITSIMLISLIRTGEYRLSQTKFENYLSFTNTSESTRFEWKEKYRSQVVAITNLPLKSVSKARRLSTFLPSSGLFYAGSPGKGLINLGLQLATAGYLTVNILAQNYATAATFNLHLVRLFYTGGVNQTDALVKSHNSKIIKTEEKKLEDLVFSFVNTN